MQDHKRHVDAETVEVFAFAMQKYKVHIQELENRDIANLKKTINEYKRLREDLLRELDTQENKEKALL